MLDLAFFFFKEIYSKTSTVKAFSINICCFEAPKTKKWPYESTKHRQRAHPRKKDAGLDAKDRRCGRCKARRKGASRDACLRTKQCMYSTATAYHQKLWSKRLFGEGYILRKSTYMQKILYMGKFKKSPPPPKDRRQGLRILLKTSVHGRTLLYKFTGKYPKQFWWTPSWIKIPLIKIPGGSPLKS